MYQLRSPTDQQLSDLNAHAVKAFGNDWNSNNRHDNNNGGGGNGNGSGNGGDNSSKLRGISRNWAGWRGSRAVDSAVMLTALLLSAQPARCERR